MVVFSVFFQVTTTDDAGINASTTSSGNKRRPYVRAIWRKEKGRAKVQEKRRQRARERDAGAAE